MALVDSFFYERFVLAPWNLVMYNVFKQGDGGGPDVFGREPWYFYFVNGFLNFNVVFLFALAALPVLVSCAEWLYLLSSTD